MAPCPNHIEDRDNILKVAFLSYCYGLEETGIGKYSWYIVNELSKLGVHVDVFTAKFHFKSLGPPFFYMKNMFLKLKNYDLIHSNEGAGLFLNHPCIIETYHHDYKQIYDFNSLVFYGLETLQCHKVQHVVVPSFMTKKRLLHYGFKEDKISVIHHGVDHSVFKKNGASRIFLRRKYGLSDYFVVINVGQLIKRKRQIDIIRALQGIPNTAFILVGNGKEGKNIRKLARKTGVRLIYFKHVAESFLVDLYSAADVYIHTSILEGFGLTVLEAMACGLPIIAYDTADFEHVVGDGGYLLKKGDLVGITSAVTFLRENEREKKRLSKKAEKRSNIFSWEKSARAHHEIYEKMLSNDCARENAVQKLKEV